MAKIFKRLFLTLIIIIVAFLLWFLVHWLIDGGWPTDQASGEKIPINITKVQPTDGETVSSRSSYCVNFEFRAGNGMGEQAVAKIHFFYDGKEVTQQTNGLVTLDLPPSAGSFCYKSDIQFSEGWHSAKVNYTDVTGKSFGYLWRFLIKK
jgi:hypothetical protein